MTTAARAVRGREGADAACRAWRARAVRQIVGYTVVLLAATVVPFAIGSFGSIYLAGALVLGGVFLVLAARLARRTTRRDAALVFHYSLLYLALLFVVAAIDLSV